MSKDLKESMELIDALEIIAVKGIEISKAQTLGEKLEKALELGKSVDQLVAGFKGADGVIEEIKDVDQAELLALGTKLFSTYKKVKAAL